MSKQKQRRERLESESESGSEESRSEELLNLYSYIDASEMYLEVLKLSTQPIGYKIGLIVVNFGKAYLALTETDNNEIIKTALKAAMNEYTEAIKFFESGGAISTEAGIGSAIKQFINISKLIIFEMKNQLKKLN